MRPRFRIGLRTIKTALSVMLSLYLASFFGELSIFPALASVSVMSRTFDDGLRECRNQAVGIVIGGVFGCGTVFLLPDPPIWVMGLGVMVIIFICASFHMGFSCSLSSAIFIVACMTDPDQVASSVLTRLFHTAIGLGTGLAINYLIVPYNNSKKIYELLEDLTEQIPDCLDQCIWKGLRPDLTPMDELIARLDYEMSIYRHQRFFRKRLHRDEFVYMNGCLQLGKRIHQELWTLCAMDRTGMPDADNFLQLRRLGLEAPETGLPVRNNTPEDDAVTNYHLRKLLEARLFLLQLLKDKDI